jgi:hypothetical protein
MGDHLLGEDTADLASLGFCGDTVTVSCPACGEVLGNVPVELLSDGLEDLTTNLIDFLDVRPAFARRSPATASAALLRAGLVGNGSAALGKHRPFIGDAVLIVSKPTLHECDAALVYANGDDCGLLLVDKLFVQAIPKGIRPFIGGCGVLLFCVIDGDVIGSRRYSAGRGSIHPDTPGSYRVGTGTQQRMASCRFRSSTGHCP